MNHSWILTSFPWKGESFWQETVLPCFLFWGGFVRGLTMKSQHEWIKVTKRKKQTDLLIEMIEAWALQSRSAWPNKTIQHIKNKIPRFRERKKAVVGANVCDLRVASWEKLLFFVSHQQLSDSLLACLYQCYCRCYHCHHYYYINIVIFITIIILITIIIIIIIIICICTNPRDFLIESKKEVHDNF